MSKHKIVKSLTVGTCMLAFGFTYSQNKPKVVLDNFFNNEKKENKETIEIESWHYTWDDKTNGGFSLLGEIFKKQGATISSLKNAPTQADLKKADIYIIVDADIDKEAFEGKANLIDPTTIKNVVKWVKAGGVLVLLSNDHGNSEFEHFNKLAGEFGIHFNDDSYNRVQGREFEQGAVHVPEGNEVFSAQKLYMKEVSSIVVKEPAKTLLSAEGKSIAAIAKFGKGTVFALGDPWCYNEYTDGKKLPADFTNFQGAEEFVKWLIKQSK
jgi:unsaturated rhamnogalacturonyl hydrolase